MKAVQFAYSPRGAAVLMARDTEGNIRSVVAPNWPYVPKAIKNQLDEAAGDVYANGRGHAEMAALAYIQKNQWTVLGGAANRNICAFCENSIRVLGGSLGGQTFSGRVKIYANGIFSDMGERMFSP